MGRSATPARARGIALAALAAIAVHSPAALAERAADPQAAALASLMMESAVESVASTQCDSPGALVLAIYRGLDGRVSPDTSFTADRARELKDRLHKQSSGLSRLCADTLKPALSAAGGPFEKVATSMTAVFEAMEPAARDELIKFLDSSAGNDFARVFRILDEQMTEAWIKWLSQKGTIVLEQFVRSAEARLPAVRGGPSRPAARVAGSGAHDGDATSPPPPPPIQPDLKIAPARLLPDPPLAQACQSFYPVPSRMLHEEGIVTVLIYVAQDGRLASLQIETSSGYPALDVAAAACIGAAARFTPMQRDGQPVGSWQRLKWNWRLTN